MKKYNFSPIAIIFVVVIFCISCSQPNKDKTTITKQKNITYTTLDVKNEYEVIRIITGCSDVTADLSKENILSAYGAAWTNISKEAYNNKADAVVGIHVEFITTTNNVIIIVYGTAVKYK